MADLTITIPKPVLSGSAYFKVRYRQLPSGGWSAYSNRSNLAFTITGLAEGEYEFEFIVVQDDGTECSSTYRTYTIVDEYECIDFSAVLVQIGALFYLDISYTLPPGHTDPACGWEIEYRPFNNPVQKVHYNTLPASGKFSILTSRDGGVLYIRANQCNGKVKDCYSADVTGVSEAPCEPLNINPVATVHRSGGMWYITINFAQSFPPSSSVYLAFKQSNIPANYSGQRFFKRAYIASNATSVTVQIPQVPIIIPGMKEVKYTGMIVDDCGQGVTFNGTYIL